MNIPFKVYDVFTKRTFGGNPLAVITDARGLNDQQMQNIAMEFNYSETTFVLPPERNGDYRVRIFCISSELPFAGHPNIGTAIALAEMGKLPSSGQFIFEESAGNVPVSVTKTEEGWWAELKAPEVLQLGEVYSANEIAEVLSLAAQDIETLNHPPQIASVGLPFLMVQVSSIDVLARCRIDSQLFERLRLKYPNPFIHVYCYDANSGNVRCRMFAPGDGVPEDPATGSANCALAGLLAELNPALTNGEQHFTIEQGVEMGRPSELVARVAKAEGQVVAVYIAGNAVGFSRGEILLDDAG